MPSMSRAALIVILVAALAGLGLGLYFGWVVSPVQYVDTEPSSLQASYKDDYVLMIITTLPALLLLLLMRRPRYAVATVEAAQPTE